MNTEKPENGRASILDEVERGLLALVTFMMAFIILLTLAQVFYRYALNDALSWSAELTKIVFIWMTFLGSGVAVNRGRHLRIDSFVDRFSERSRLITDIAVHTGMVMFLIVLLVVGLQLSWKAITILTGALQWPRTVLFLPVPIGSFFMLLFAMRIVDEDLRKLRTVGNREKG